MRKVLLLVVACAAARGQTPVTGTLPFNAVDASKRNIAGGFAGLDASGKFPWAQISGVPTASATVGGILLAPDWLLIHGAEQTSKKNLPGGYAGIGTNGLVLPSLLPAPLTKLSQFQNDPGFYSAATLPKYPVVPGNLGAFTNDPGFTTALQAAAAAPVQSVNGLMGVVLLPIPTKLSQLTNDIGLSTGGSPVPIPTKVSDLPNDAGYLTPQTLPPYPVLPVVPTALSAFANDPGYATTVQVQQAIAAIPAPQAPPVNVSQLNNDAGYVNASQSAAAAPVQSVNGQKGDIVLPSSGSGGAQVSVAAYGAKGDGVTDARAAIQAAINAAKTINKFAAMDSTNPYFAADVFFPPGIYALGGPLYLPRTNQTSYPNGPANGTVSLIGAAPGSVVLTWLPSPSWLGVTGAQLTNPGTNYVGTTTVAFSGGGCTTEPVGAVLLMAGTTNVAEVYTVSDGSGCTSMPSCTITGSGTGATCEALGHGMVEWDALPAGTFKRTFGQEVRNIRFRSPSIPGTMAINFQMTAAPNSGGTFCSIGYANVCERLMNAVFSDLDFEDDNIYNPASLHIGGDCNTCSFINLSNNPHLSTAAGAYQTPLIMTSYWVDATSDEGDGLFLGTLVHLASGGTKNGAAPAFVGRAIRSSFMDVQCDGVRNGTPPAVCFAWYNSVGVNGQNLSVEGTAGTQFLIQNSKQFFFSNIGIGSGNAANSGIPAPNGIVLINTDESRFEGAMASQTDFATGGGLRLSVDAQSVKNQFLGFELAGTDEVSGIGGTSNYLQYCVVGSCASGTGWSHLGTSPY